MKPKTMILMVVAVTCGLGASYMTSQLLAERAQPDVQAPSTEEKVSVLVARKPLSVGTIFKNPDDDFQIKLFVRGQEPANALTDTVQLKGERLKRSLRVGDYVSKDDLVDKAHPGLAEELPDGMRAIGLPVNQLVAAGGFASLPGSYVDILWTARGSSARDTFTNVLLEKVKILAADTNDTRPEDKKWVLASVITVALSSEDALLASIAMETGSLRFLLRNHSDSKLLEVSKKTLEDVLKVNQSKKKSDEDDGPDGAGKTRSGVPTELVPDVEGKKGDPSAPLTVEPPLWHKLTIHNGSAPTTAKFELDRKTKEVVSTDVTAPEPPPRPTVQQQPPAGSNPPAPPAPPAPGGNGKGPPQRSGPNP
jgi:Flp pilus assembly protein CpaB